MSESEKLLLAAGTRISYARALKNVIESELERRSRMSIILGDSTVGVNIDSRGDWTISVGLSLKSDGFHLISTGLEGIGFFQATENEGTSYFLWTSLLTQTENARSATAQVLAQVMKILQAAPVSQYIR